MACADGVCAASVAAAAVVVAGAGWGSRDSGGAFFMLSAMAQASSANSCGKQNKGSRQSTHMSGEGAVPHAGIVKP